ncbi:MAG: L-glutamate gamma-semialdehyde dehydrogenase [Candidatus Scalindua sp. AMX11]|nr:MAG: L-glutamate gamma-semialdehyde dehydrogenase [Candidatus Scalindua sp.]NOG82272.1 L-glutamate gamma-semialdehyde dehydrogenase [Planctomycetota bacterium]RZV71437.1 MAG: L-glutamate gamma-semialdehyde dehydrogenase [Candidatus Scalindua sp. SCAELEC01]TDE64299.1 MAG: L-glutamate gamma-semialdehyde dehydrogenase [Candidatus Scalindua sp. AMX11]GJQ59941.1 MAG: 1-pyrroline-5-carboxylate dehydrogenase [Candidatus Scalindua sp.]
MSNAKFNLNLPINETIKSYAPNSPERKIIKAKLSELRSQQGEIPLIIGGKEIKTGNTGKCILPHDHETVIGTYHKAGKSEIVMAIEAALNASTKWARMEWQDRAAIFLKAAEILSGPWRPLLNASTMLGQSKNVFQAEVDSACELIDFLRFNPFYAMQIYENQPLISSTGTWNRSEYRPLEGFVFASTPFNFTSIAGNLASAPTIMGNVVLWKPASNAVYSSYLVMKLFEEAGLPDGVINFIPGPGEEIGPIIINSPDLAGIHFTGSTSTFQNIWQAIGKNIRNYKSYPRIVGETGGKDFVFAHHDTEIETLGTALIRGAFEYQGQKCSAASRAYIPRSIWPELNDFILSELKTVRMGDVEDFGNFVNAVIDKSAFDKITQYLEYMKTNSETEILCGGNYDSSKGYFIEPTVAVTTNPHSRTMEEEIFGPILTVYVYENNAFEETLHLCDKTSPYGLTGSIFSRNREAITTAEKILVNAAGNFYINDKPSGAAVGQQPFGGSRLSGTDDKAGSILNMIRWVSPRTIKETFTPPVDYRYPFMAPD